MQTVVVTYPSPVYDPSVSQAIDLDPTLKRRVTAMLDTMKTIIGSKSHEQVKMLEGKLVQGTQQYIVRVAVTA